MLIEWNNKEYTIKVTSHEDNGDDALYIRIIEWILAHQQFDDSLDDLDGYDIRVAKKVWNVLIHPNFVGLAIPDGVQEKRMKVLFGNIKFALEYNSKNQQSKLAINPFALLRPEELQNFFASFEEEPEIISEKGNEEDLPILGGSIENNYDWRDFGVVNPPLNQGSCGSCWAFSSTSVIESVMAIQNNYLFKLSPQQLVSCFEASSYGCRGGNPAKVYREYSPSHDVGLSRDFRYKASDAIECPSDIRGIVQTRGLVNNHHVANEDIRRAVRRNPVSVAVDSSSRCFSMYSHGVLNSKDCDSKGHKVNHAVVVVGYGNFDSTDETNPPYWIVKNSWGDWWGDHGYLNIEITNIDYGEFLINTQVTYPLEAKFSDACSSSRSAQLECRKLGKFVSGNFTPYNPSDNTDQSIHVIEDVIIGAMVSAWMIMVAFSLVSLVRKQFCKPREVDMDSDPLLVHVVDS